MRLIKIIIVLLLLYSENVSGQTIKIRSGKYIFEAPANYFEERKDIPKFWISSVTDVNNFLLKTVKKGRVQQIGISAGGHPIYAVVYGKARSGSGTTTFSGSLGYGKIKAYRGPDNDKLVYMGLSGVHGGEFEPIVGMVNLIAAIETGKDLNGKSWPEINAAVKNINRLILIPIANPDGRLRIPIKMETYGKNEGNIAEYINTGGDSHGKITGWPNIKEFIPMDFKKPGFPGGYPNDNGVNIMHDDFLGKPQPETRALLNLVAKEKPDLILNMHTGALYVNMHRPFQETMLMPVFDSLYKTVHTRLASEGLLKTKNIPVEADPANAPKGTFNLDAALNLNSGALCALIESPSHAFTPLNVTKIYTPEMLLNAQLYCHLEAMNFLITNGGRSKWAPGK